MTVRTQPRASRTPGNTVGKTHPRALLLHALTTMTDLDGGGMLLPAQHGLDDNDFGTLPPPPAPCDRQLRRQTQCQRRCNDDNSNAMMTTATIAQHLELRLP
jgi:hypothetical protein